MQKKKLEKQKVRERRKKRKKEQKRDTTKEKKRPKKCGYDFDKRDKQWLQQRGRHVQSMPGGYKRREGWAGVGGGGLQSMLGEFLN